MKVFSLILVLIISFSSVYGKELETLYAPLTQAAKTALKQKGEDQLITDYEKEQKDYIDKHLKLIKQSDNPSQTLKEILDNHQEQGYKPAAFILNLWVEAVKAREKELGISN